MESGAVIKGLDVVEDGGSGFGVSGEALVVDNFVFKAAPEGFDEGVVVAIAFATHGSDQAVLSQDLPVSGAGELHAAIRVDDKGCFGTALQKCHAQSGYDEAGVKDLVHRPADDAPSPDIEDGDEIEPALGGEDAGGIGHPGLIGSVNGEVWKPVGCDRSAVLAVGCPGSVFGALPGKDPLRAHETSDAIAPAGATQSLRQSWTAIGLATAGKLLANALAEMDVFQLARAGSAPAFGPLVIAAARDQERFT